MSDAAKAKLKALHALGQGLGTPKATHHAAADSAILADLKAFGSPAALIGRRVLDKEKEVRRVWEQHTAS